ncbi:hypothetical protein KPH14_008644 [Odynerus spinipes]|uniref:Uncharacterized protein n=1 Tax=Odynerus spinipes TaxID=1348599 RepID=A0AAD9VT41_9HYME|nr:hypothetical protein KPH14_008644 [Odynerus spinipes]
MTRLSANERTNGGTEERRNEGTEEAASRCGGAGEEEEAEGQAIDPSSNPNFTPLLARHLKDASDGVRKIQSEGGSKKVGRTRGKGDRCYATGNGRRLSGRTDRRTDGQGTERVRCAATD